MTDDNGNPPHEPDPAAAAARGLTLSYSIPRTSTPLPKIPLGEELPLFCERCGYSLNGLAQFRCEHCRVLHFSCPECDHHQPINTLRPAALRIIGRLRAIGLALLVFVKINIFFWSLFIWGAAGMGISYSYQYYSNTASSYGQTGFEWEGGVILFLFGALFGMVGRMLLLRWRRGMLIGLVLGGLVVLAMCVGAELRQLDYNRPLPSPYGVGFVMYMTCAFIGAWFGASVVWGIWLALATAFLPKRAATALLEWQSAMSAPKGAKDRTDATTSVTA